MAHTIREKYLASLRGESVDELVLALNFDYYYIMNEKRGTLPEKYRDMTVSEAQRAVNAVMWRRMPLVDKKYDKSVKVTHYSEPEKGKFCQKIETPVGEIWQESGRTEDEFSSPCVTKHFITDLESLRVMTYVTEATYAEPNYERIRELKEAVGDDGVVLATDQETPFVRFAKRDAGYGEAFYIWSDYPDEVERLVEAYHKLAIDIVRMQVKSDADIIHCNDDMDELTISPTFFRQYVLPFYQELRREIEGSGKLLGAHWCGRTPHLLPMAKESGLHFIEAATTDPLSSITLAQSLDILDGKVGLQCGVPSIYMCRESCTDEEYDRYMREIVRVQKGRPGFVVGMADNVPPNADFARVERMYALLNE